VPDRFEIASNLRGAVRLFDALEISERIRRHVGGAAEVSTLRRRHELIGEIALLASEPAALARFVSHPEVVRIESQTERGVSVRLAGGVRASLAVTEPELFAAALLIRTGSAEHVAKLEARASARGLVLERIAAESEAELYRRLELPYIPPELREDLGELEAEEEPELVELTDIRGMVHCHTLYSDGRATIEEMARAADLLGVEYLTITDHSPSAFYARGVELDRLKEQWDEIAEVQERVKVRLLRGTESDILADGSLDYPDSILEQLDVVIASIHSRHQMGEDAMTERIVRAMKHPVFKIWGHPLGRLLLKRDPIPCRVEEVLDVMSEQRAAIEISGDPDRMELEPRWIRAARARGIPFVVSVDAHSTRALGHLELGVHLARRGGVRASEVLNAAGAEQFLASVRPAP
jgi:DNA polymerase (family 10)